MTKPTALVIGAGMGGIASAARLARHGYAVTVVEKGERAGGRCSRLIKDGHHFDTGPTLFLMPELYAQTFADLGERMEDHLDLRRIDPGYHLHFDDGSYLTLTSDLSAMQEQLEAIEPGSFGRFLRYLEEGHCHYRLALPHLVQRSFDTLLEFCNLKNLVLLFRLKLLVKHYAHVGRYFQDRRLKAAFTFQDMYMSLNPYEAPATYSLFQYAELAGGIWFPMGGMARLVEALTQIAETNGARFLYNAPVERINVNGRRVTGVTLTDGREIGADLIVANSDLPYVYRCLLPDDGTAGRLDTKRYTCSAVTFYWGVNRQYPQLGPHNLFLAGDYRQSFERILRDLTLPEEPSFYLHAPARVDPSLAPPGHDTLMVVVPVGHIDEAQHEGRDGQDWGIIQARARQFVLQRLAQIGLSDLVEHIKFEVSYTPRDWQSRYNLTKGSTLGLAHNLTQMGYLRPHNRHACYHNLYFVGSSTHPGNGVATVLVSARLTADHVLKDAGMTHSAAITTPTSTGAQAHGRKMTANKGSASVNNGTAALARSITRASSKQSYLTARLLVDRDLVDDCCRAYGYFRWADDVVDAPTPVDAPAQSGAPTRIGVPAPSDILATSNGDGISFIKRQRALIERLYQNVRLDDLTPEEEIIADLIGNDRGENSGLQSFVRNFLAIIEFDAHRRGRLISQQELTWYSDRLGKAVTDAIQYFIGHGHPYPDGNLRYLGATAAHITHMLRDMVEDTADGYINIPREYLDAHGISPHDLNSPPFRAWVEERVEQARAYFRQGKGYIDGLEVLRCKIAAHWYCARFEGVLDTIERDGYVLRPAYSERSKLSTWLKMAGLALSVSLRHMARRGRRDARQSHRQLEPEQGEYTATEGIS